LPGSVAQMFRDAVDAFAERFSENVTWLRAEDFFLDGDPDLDWFTVTSAEHVAALGRAWTTKHMTEFHIATQEFLSSGLDVTIEEYLAARRRRYSYVRRMDELLRGGGLLLTPSVAADGWLADGRMTEGSEVHGLAPEVYSTAVQNITGHPAISIPFGHLPAGLPFGVQVTAEHYHDLRLIDIAKLMEESYPWARTASGYETFGAALNLS
jgi:Asp-tRNA(Asn)/Glu-tRNA(Gln) amidotransferase A subunit family amidase